MRIIWISIVLFGVLIVAGIGTYEPGTTAPTSAANSTANQQPLENPFAEETTASKDVDLPALPQKQAEDTENQIDPQTEGIDNVASIEADAAIPHSSSGESSITPESIEQSSTEDLSSITPAENPDAAPVSSAETESPKPRKLGLAMLELQKENKRNKIAVIVHADNPQELTAKEIKAMYLDRLTQWQDGSKVMLYNLPLGDKYREKFSKNILNMTALEADSAELQRRELKINVNPVEVKAKNIVVSYVEQHPNAVAYVPLLMVREKSNVKVIMTIP